MLLTALRGPSSAAQGAASPIPSASRQLVVVTTANWTATDGTLQRFARDSAAAVWRSVGEPVPVVTGRSGLGWGVGLHPGGLPGPVKQEGDGRAPAGAFRLTDAFGYADSTATGLPYVQARSGVQCVDDSDSAFYNRVLFRRSVAPDWRSHERMLRADDLYRVGVIVQHNGGSVGSIGPEATPRAGSCIFLHVWRGAGSSTAGCTAMPETDLRAVMQWLTIDADPVLVQVPMPMWARYAEVWGLPRLPQTR